MLHTPAPFGRYRRSVSIRNLVCAALVLCSATPAVAQQQQQGQQGQAAQEEQQPRGGEEWYRAQLAELSEVLGGAHYLRILCEGRGDQLWRDYMRGVISREPRYNGVLVEGFNRGYRAEEARFPVCDAATRQMEAELRARGLRIAQALSARHAGAR